MADILRVQKDDYDTEFVFHTKFKNKIVPLVGAQVIFEFFSKNNNQRCGGGECTIINTGGGLAKYKFKGEELKLEGQYQANLIVDLSKGASRRSLSFDFEVVVDGSKEDQIPDCKPAS